MLYTHPGYVRTFWPRRMKGDLTSITPQSRSHKLKPNPEELGSKLNLKTKPSKFSAPLGAPLRRSEWWLFVKLLEKSGDLWRISNVKHIFDDLLILNVKLGSSDEVFHVLDASRFERDQVQSPGSRRLLRQMNLLIAPRIILLCVKMDLKEIFSCTAHRFSHRLKGRN